MKVSQICPATAGVGFSAVAPPAMVEFRAPASPGLPGLPSGGFYHDTMVVS